MLKGEKPVMVEGTLGSQRNHFMATSLLIAHVPFVVLGSTPIGILSIRSVRQNLATRWQQQVKNLPSDHCCSQTDYNLANSWEDEDPYLCYNLL